MAIRFGDDVLGSRNPNQFRRFRRGRGRRTLEHCPEMRGFEAHDARAIEI